MWFLRYLVIGRKTRLVNQKFRVPEIMNSSGAVRNGTKLRAGSRNRNHDHLCEGETEARVTYTFKLYFTVVWNVFLR